MEAVALEGDRSLPRAEGLAACSRQALLPAVAQPTARVLASAVCCVVAGGARLRIGCWCVLCSGRWTAHAGCAGLCVCAPRLTVVGLLGSLMRPEEKEPIVQKRFRVLPGLPQGLHNQL